MKFLMALKEDSTCMCLHSLNAHCLPQSASSKLTAQMSDFVTPTDLQRPENIHIPLVLGCNQQ